MNIAIDATTLLLQSAGVKNYIYYWLLALREAVKKTGDAVFTYPAGVPVPPVLDHQASTAGLLGTFSRMALLNLSNVRHSPVRDLLLLGQHVFHCSQHSSAVPRRISTTATVFDLSCWTLPAHHTPKNVVATKLYAERILKHSDGLIAISEYSRQDAIAELGIQPARIRVIYPGVAEAFYVVMPADAAAVRAKYALNRPYILFVGCIEPRKNVPGLIRAFSQLPAAIRRDAELVIAGPFGWESQDVRRMLQDPASGVRYFGYVPEADLPGLVRGASALAYASFYEGFGLPAAQAMAAGVPVIVSNRASLPEVVGNAGMIVDPDKEGQLAAALEHMLTNSEAAREFGSRGRHLAQNYRWSKCAAQSLDFFHEFAGRPIER